MVAAVTFDFWNTLMYERPLGTLREGRMAFWQRELGDVDPAALGDAHDAAHDAYGEAWRAGRQYVVEDAAADMARELERPDLEPGLLAGFSEGSAEGTIEVCDHAAQALAALRDAGMGLGIVCDIGLTPSPVLLDLLDRRGLLEYFGAPVFSDQVGSYKPGPEMFEVALEKLGAAPENAAHIGDRLRTDVGGARALGMTSVRYTAVFDDPADLPEADAVVGDLAEIPSTLEALA